MSNNNDLLSRAKALNSRVKKQEQEREEAQREARDAEYKRYWLLMSSMVRARKSMREMQALDLGDRFFFSTNLEEVDGWPKLALQLQDSNTPDACFPTVRVQVQQREDQGVIEVAGHDLTDVQHVDLSHEVDVERVANILKKSVKSYLDFVGDVIEAVLSDGESPYTFGPPQKADPKVKKPDSPNLGGDLFVDDEPNKEFLETVGSDDIEALPSFDT